MYLYLCLRKKHPDNSYIAKIDDNGKLTIYDLNGNEVNLNVNGKYRINVVAHGSEMVAIGAELCVVLPVTSALMVPLPLSYNLCATNCAKELTSPLEEGLSVSQPTKAIRPCSVILPK
jgi:hypothetical protein